MIREQTMSDFVGRRGVLRAVIQAEKPELVNLFGIPLRQALKEMPEIVRFIKDVIYIGPVCNAYVNTGLNNSLDREFGLGGAAVSHIGVSSNATAVTASTVFLNGASGGAAANTIIKSISPVASRVAQTTTGGATFVNADFTSGVFVMNKLGFLNTSTDAGTGLIDVIGGTGGASPYNRNFSIDLVNAGTFTLVPQIAVTGVAAAA